MLTRAQMEDVIRRGGSVLVNGRIAFKLEHLPTEAALAKTPEEKEKVSKSLDEQIAELQAQKAGLASNESVEFTPLSEDEVRSRVESGDYSDEVVKSMAFYLKKVADDRKTFLANEEKLSESKESSPADTTDQFPENFPSRAVFGKSGKSFDEVKSLTKEQLLEITGIGPATAEAVLAYQK